MKKQINGFVHLRTSSWSKDDDFVLMSMKFEDDEDYLFVAEGTLNFTIPESFDPRQKKVEMLKAEKQKAMADFQALVTSIDRKISELTCLEAS